jgi:hypothetical protein
MAMIIDDFRIIKKSRKERKCNVCSTTLHINQGYIAVTLKDDKEYENVSICNLKCYNIYEKSRQ